MRKYTQDEKITALRLFEEGFSAREIFEDSNIPIGTLNRWRSEAKPQQADASGIESLQLRVQELERKLEEIYTWATKKIERESRDKEDSAYNEDGTKRFRLGK